MKAKHGFDPLIFARGVKKNYGGKAVVNKVDIQVGQGECFGLLGPNGAGKTTLMRLLLGLIQPDEGEIRLLGLPIPQRAREARARVGVVPQFDNLDPDFTVEENLLIWGSYFTIPRDQTKARIPELLAFAGLEGKAGSRISELSGGMKRRLTLARSLINDPEILFLDEPTTGLDPQARHLIWARLRDLIAGKKTLFLTTHFMEEAERLCDRLAVMDAGCLVAQGTPQGLIEEHIEPQVLEVTGDGVWRCEEEARKLAARTERVGETLFCYTHDPRPLFDAFAKTPGTRSILRPANLEDVFLRLTGRDLRD